MAGFTVIGRYTDNNQVWAEIVTGPTIVTRKDAVEAARAATASRLLEEIYGDDVDDQDKDAFASALDEVNVLFVIEGEHEVYDANEEVQS